VRSVLYAQLVEPSLTIAPRPPDTLLPGRTVPAGTVVADQSLTMGAIGDGAEQGIRDEDDEPEASSLAQAKAILRVLGFPDEGPELSVWRSLGRGDSALHKLAHRSALNPPRQFDAQVIGLVDSTARLFDTVLDRFEARYAEVYARLDDMLARDIPTKADIRLLKRTLPNTPTTHGYFFGRLTHIGWLDPLARAGFFRSPPRPERNPEHNTVQFAHWMVLDYLARIASAHPDAVAAVVSTIPETDNARVQEQLIDVVLRLRSTDRRVFAPRIISWGPNLERYPWGNAAVRLAIALADEGSSDLALLLSARLIGLPEGAAEARTRPAAGFSRADRKRPRQLREHADTLFTALTRNEPLATLRVLADALDYHVGRRTEDVDAAPDLPEGLFDYSEYWAPRLIRQNLNGVIELRMFLTLLLSQCVVQLGMERRELLSDAVATLRQFGARVLRRIELSSLAELLRSESQASQDAARPLAMSCLTSTRMLTTGDLDSEIGVLLQALVPLLSDAERQQVLDALVPPDFSWMQHPEYAARRRAQWRRDRLALIRQYLPARERGELSALIASEGEAASLNRPETTVASAVGPRSPLDDAELRALQAEELLGFLSAWRPDEGRTAATRHGLALTITAMLADDPAKYGPWVSSFVGQDAVYVAAVLEGVRSAARADKFTAWTNVLTLADWLITQPVLDDDTTERDDDPTSDWRRARRALADIIGMAIGVQWDSPDALPWGERERVWRVISVLAEDQNPSPAYEARAGAHMDPTGIAINTVRPEAIDAAIRFAFWSAQHRDQTDIGLHNVLGGVPEAATLLERHLDPANDPSVAVRSVIGQWLTPLTRTDPHWITSHRSQLFPDAPEDQPRRSALWDAFTQWSEPHPEALTVLEPEYRAAIDRTLGPREGHRHEEPEDRLAEHIVSLYWWGAIPLDSPDNLMVYFFEHADSRRRAHALQYVGFSLFHREDEVDPDALERLRRLWDWRAAHLLRTLGDGQAQPPSSARAVALRELREFGWWFSARAFEPDWALERLAEVLRVAGTVESDHAVVEYLVELAATHPGRVIACMQGVDYSGGGEPWTAHSWIEQFAAILTPTLADTDPETRRKAREVVNRAVAAGHVGFRDLLG
jgi:hypothetical protein